MKTLFCVLFLACFTCHGQDLKIIGNSVYSNGVAVLPSASLKWVLVYETDSRKYYVRSKSVPSFGSDCKVWVKCEFSTLEVKGKTYNNPHSISLMRYDCTESKSQMVSVYIYSESGETIASEEHPDNHNNMSIITPDTMGEEVWEKVCLLRPFLK